MPPKRERPADPSARSRWDAGVLGSGSKKLNLTGEVAMTRTPAMAPERALAGFAYESPGFPYAYATAAMLASKSGSHRGHPRCNFAPKSTFVCAYHLLTSSSSRIYAGVDRQAELDLIDAHVAARGVTRCPDRYVSAVDLAMSEVEAGRRLAAMPRPRRMTHAEFSLTVYAGLFSRSR